jgi:hypothetical protein
MLLGPGLAERIVQGIAQAISRQENAAAFEGFAFHMGRGVQDGGKGSNDHGGSLDWLGPSRMTEFRPNENAPAFPQGRNL